MALRGALLAVSVALLAASPPALAAAASGRAAAARPAHITFYFGLERPERAARTAWTAVGNPASSEYRQFGSPVALARRYGASPANVRRFAAGSARP